MKVLITGCSKDGYWYSDRIGHIFDCKVDNRSGVESRFLLTGLLLNVVSWRDGELLYTESEYNQVNQELLQRREEVKQLTIERDGYLAHIKLSECWTDAKEDLLKDSRKHEEEAIRTSVSLRNDNIKLKEDLKKSRLSEENAIRIAAELNKDKRGLLRDLGALKGQLSRVWVGQPEKVVLPREVAEEIESFRKDGHDVDYIVYWLTRNHPENHVTTERIKILEDYASVNGFTLISALVNGYTIEEPEETADDKIIRLYKSICEKKCNPEEAEVMRAMAILQGNTELIRCMDIVDGDMPF